MAIASSLAIVSSKGGRTVVNAPFCFIDSEEGTDQTATSPDSYPSQAFSQLTGMCIDNIEDVGIGESF